MGSYGGYSGPYAFHIEGPDAPTISDDHGSSWYSATPVAIGSVTPGTLDVQGDLDYFQFTVSASGTYVMYTRNVQNEHPMTTGTLYNESLVKVAENVYPHGGEEDNFRIEAALTPGTYYLRVGSYGGYSGPYAFHIDAPCGSSATDLSVSGVVRNSATHLPLSGVTVRLEDGTSVTTDGSGSYSFSGLSTGTYLLSFLKSGYPPRYDVASLCSSSISLPDEYMTGLAAVYGTSSSTNSGYSADPVNTSTGNYVFQRTDLSIPGKGFPFSFSRTYNSQDNTSGSLGYGWTHNYASTLSVGDNSTVTIRWGDGKTEAWTPDGSGGTPRSSGCSTTWSLWVAGVIR